MIGLNYRISSLDTLDNEIDEKKNQYERSNGRPNDYAGNSSWGESFSEDALPTIEIVTFLTFSTDQLVFAGDAIGANSYTCRNQEQNNCQSENHFTLKLK